MTTHRILILTTSEGHRSIGEAVYQSLQNQEGVFVELQFIEEPGLVFYRFFYLHFPQFFQFIFALSFTKVAQFFLLNMLLREHQDFIQKKVADFAPTVIINTSFGFTPSIEKIKKQHPSIRFVNIIPNPRTFFYQDIADSADINFVFDRTIEQSVLYRKPKTHTQISGWFVRNEFTFLPKEQAKKHFDILPDTFTLLLVTGSEGTRKILDLIPHLLQFSKRLTIFVACGKNTQLVESLKQFTPPSHITLIPFGFTKEIFKYIQAADLVIGKAGPNMLFESVATHTPFFAMTHVAGLEDGNLEVIKEYDLGFVEEDTPKIIAQLKMIIEDPKLLTDKKKSVMKMAKYNDQAGVKLINEIVAREK